MALRVLCDLAFSLSLVLFCIILLIVCIEHYNVLPFQILECVMPSPTLGALHMLPSVWKVLTLTPILEILAQMSRPC